jgi:hypothetical protein
MPSALLRLMAGMHPLRLGQAVLGLRDVPLHAFGHFSRRLVLFALVMLGRFPDAVGGLVEVLGGTVQVRH